MSAASCRCSAGRQHRGRRQREQHQQPQRGVITRQHQARRGGFDHGRKRFYPGRGRCVDREVADIDQKSALFRHRSPRYEERHRKAGVRKTARHACCPEPLRRSCNHQQRGGHQCIRSNDVAKARWYAYHRCFPRSEAAMKIAHLMNARDTADCRCGCAARDRSQCSFDGAGIFRRCAWRAPARCRRDAGGRRAGLLHCAVDWQARHTRSEIGQVRGDRPRRPLVAARSDRRAGRRGVGYRRRPERDRACRFEVARGQGLAAAARCRLCQPQYG